MKKNTLAVVILSLYFILAEASFVNAQKPLQCGPYVIDTSAENFAGGYLKPIDQRPMAVNRLIRVFFHITTDDDGTNAAITLAQLNTEFNNLLASYAPANICFLNAGVDTINNTYLNTGFNADDKGTRTAFSPFSLPDCINIFYVRRINGNNTACNPPCGYGGIALGGIPGTLCLVASSNLGASLTTSHEVGHCLGLLHTFEKAYGLEKIDGTNAASTGDRVADTPADPFAYNADTCYSVSANGCVYTGSCTDPSGRKDFNPPYNNLMSYWWDAVCAYSLATTNGQFARVNSFLDSNQPLKDCSSPYDFTLTGIIKSSGTYMESGINTFLSSGNVIFSGSVNATLGGGKVSLKPGFLAIPGVNGIVRIVSSTCQ